MVSQVITEGQEAGEIRCGNPDELAAICLELLNPRALQHIAHAVGGSPEDAADRIVEFVLHGLAVR
jgi:hypothetical protein